MFNDTALVAVSYVAVIVIVVVASQMMCMLVVCEDTWIVFRNLNKWNDYDANTTLYEA